MKKKERVNLVLSLHGAGSIGNWQRHYFRFTDYKDKYRLVVITPPPQPTSRRAPAQAAADDDYLHDVVDLVTANIGKQNIPPLLAGRPQPGRRDGAAAGLHPPISVTRSMEMSAAGSARPTVMCAPAASGAPARAAGARRNAAGGAPALARAAPAALPPLDCDFSFIYSQGQLEGSVSDISTWAQKYGCGDRVREPDVVDTSAGYVTATDQTRGAGWGRFARPGTAKVWEYPKCKNGRIVADVVKLDKGHTEGYEPHITEKMIQMMVAAPVLKGPHATVKTADAKPAKKAAA